jgi:hypothetical protein
MINDQLSRMPSLDAPLDSNPGQVILETNNDDDLRNHTARAEAILAAAMPPPTTPTARPQRPQHVASIVSSDEWAKTIQEISSNGNYAKTNRKLYDKIWTNIASPYCKFWSGQKWKYFDDKPSRKHPGKYTKANISDFKSRITSWIVSQRTERLTSEIIADFNDPNFVKSLGASEHRKVLYLSQQRFIQWATETFKDDRTKMLELDKHTVNDRIRLISIAALEENRDGILKLGGGKHKSRADADGALSMSDQVFQDLATSFNDPDLQIHPPTNATFLITFGDMNANDQERIKIKRTYKWVAKVWKDLILRDYSSALVLWKLGTGGGSGAPENFSDWNARDDQKFADYGKWVGRRDDLAWVYMVDKNAQFIFNIANEPAPANTILEDGSNASSSHDQKGRGGKSNHFNEANDLSKALGETMKQGFAMITEMVKKQDTRDDVEPAGVVLRQKVGNVNTLQQIEEAVTLIRKLDEQIESMKNRQVARKRIKIIEGALDIAYTSLDALQGGGCNDSDDDSSMFVQSFLDDEE